MRTALLGNSQDTFLKLDDVYQTTLDDSEKGIPAGTEPFSLGSIKHKKWNVLREDMPMPVAVLKESALQRNSLWMKKYLATTGVSICPHGKTTMAPQLFELQLSDGAWGITASTCVHVAMYRRVGVSRIILANQLIGKSNIIGILNELKAAPDFDFYCLLDSEEGLQQLILHLKNHSIGRPLQVLLEIGSNGGRTGVRGLDDALRLARLIRNASPLVSLRGVEAFEGIYDLVKENDSDNVESLLDKVGLFATICDEEDLFGEGEVILTAGGSAHFDTVVKRFSQLRLSRGSRIVIRSGCYITHDSGFYRRAVSRLIERSAKARAIDDPPVAALEVCAYIQSVPEPGLAIANLGRRDVSYDMGLPIPLWLYRPGTDGVLLKIGDTIETVGLNDQHAYLKLGSDAEVRVGDIVGFGISHPCTTFDKWKTLYVVDEDYTVRSAVRTFF